MAMGTLLNAAAALDMPDLICPGGWGAVLGAGYRLAPVA